MMGKHTPGPWNAVWTDHPNGEGWSVDCKDTNVCLVDGPAAFNEANAALIAAAPETAAECDRLKATNAELLAAAIRVRARCQSLRLEPDAASAMDSLESAIARAESGT